MAMVVDVAALATTPTAAAACRCRHGASSSSSSSSSTPCVVGMGGGHSLPVCRGLRKVSTANKRFEPVRVQPRSPAIVAEVQEAASPGGCFTFPNSRSG